MIRLSNSLRHIWSHLKHQALCFTSNVKQQKRQYLEPIQTKFQIIDKEKINHDCYIYSFSFDGPKFPLKIGHHFKIVQNIPTIQNPEGEQVMKYYTPITSCSDFSQDKIKVLFKIYRPNEDPLYPSGGKLTPYIQSLNKGDKLNIEGPFSKFTYVSPGRIEICKTLFSKTKKVYDIKKLLFIAGGTGITPMYQTITQIAGIPSDKTQMTLIFCNKSEKDIILRKQLQSLQPRVKINHILDNGSPQWKGLRGRVNKQILNQIYPLNDPQTFYLFCGPPAMNLALNKIFQKNYPTSNYCKV